MYIFQPDRFLLSKQIEKLGKRVTGRVLDVGAGEFSRYDAFFQPSEYIRMDVVEREGVDVVGRAEDIPFESESFDSVVCTQVFEHLDKPEQSACEIFRVLKPGGTLLLTVPQMNELHEEPYDFFRYTNFGITAILERAGFKIEICEPRGGYHSMLAQVRIRHMIDSLGLYHRPLLGKLLGQWCKLYGRYAILRDQSSRSAADKKHTIGWAVLARK